MGLRAHFVFLIGGGDVRCGATNDQCGADAEWVGEDLADIQHPTQRAMTDSFELGNQRFIGWRTLGHQRPSDEK